MNEQKVYKGVRHKHKWDFARINTKTSNRDMKKFALYVCECGAYKEVKLKEEVEQ